MDNTLFFLIFLQTEAVIVEFGGVILDNFRIAVNVTPPQLHS